MILFVLICVALVAIAVAWLALPLLRSSPRVAPERSAVNLDILRDQRAELEREHEAGTLQPEVYAQAQAELEARVIEELPERVATRAIHTGERRVALVIAMLFPVLATVLYLLLGDRDAFNPEIAQAKSAQQLAQLLQAGETGIVVDQIKAQLKHKPDNSELWFLLARALINQQAFAESAAAYEKLNALEPNQPSLLTDWAEVVAHTQGRSLKGRPEELINQALSIEPGNGKALAMSGAAALERGDHAGAVAQWEKLRPLVVGTELAPQIEQSIAQARQAGNLGPEKRSEKTKSNSAAVVAGQVSIAAPQAAAAAPGDTVFVVARTVSGPRMPLAVYRAQVKDLPAKFTLNDALAMSPEHKLSAFTEVMVSARISKSGNALPQAGDLESVAVKVKVGAKDLKLVIDQVRR